MFFFAEGVPAPKGSTRAFVIKGRAVTVQANSKKLRPWESVVKDAARQAGAQKIDGPVGVTLSFVLPRPKSHFTKKGLRAGAPIFVVSKPDLDKLCRAILDAITFVVFGDDSVVVRLIAVKRYAVEGNDPPGVHVELYGMIAP